MASPPPPCQLVVFCGLPGVGKTTLSRLVAASLPATYLRIDAIEAAIAATLGPFGDNPVGYVVAGWVAADQLRAGRSVVADAVNAVDVARQGWVAVARDCSVPLRFVHVTCSDVREHRRRVESRRATMRGRGVLTWTQVQRRAWEWEPFTHARFVVDNLGDPVRHVDAVVDWLANSER